ncbi:phage portal protein [candidate division WWE3 bacterium]|uniref:Phage portal protein n=1 Tax=candidate division WWE3 bacterium TaxID=2053526 RepID=A0A3A4ZEQ3_UNCKA|nr:MAG: phage portal protein [candidate division WWE3 bacterium]
MSTQRENEKLNEIKRLMKGLLSLSPEKKPELKEGFWHRIRRHVFGEPTMRFTSEELSAALEEAFSLAKSLSSSGLSISSDKSILNDIEVVGHSFVQLQEQQTKASGLKVKEGTMWAGMGLEDSHGEAKRTIGLNYRNDARTASFVFYDTTPIGRAAIRNLSSYVFGRGIKFVSQSEEINNALQKFWNFNNLERRQKRLYKMYLNNGEQYIALINTSLTMHKTLKLRYIPPSQVDFVITEDGDIGAVYGFCRRISGTDGEKKVFYKEAFADEENKPKDFETGAGKNFEEDENVRVVSMQMGHEDETRGLPYMYPSFRWMRILLEFAMERARYAMFRQRIYGIMQKMGKFQSGSIPSYKDLPKSGGILFEDMNQKFRFETPNTGAQDSTADWKMLMYLVCAGLQIPPHILFQDSSNENYASIRKADTPFANLVLDEQDEQRDMWQRIFRYVISQLVEHTIIPKTMTIKVYKASMIGESIQWEAKQEAAINFIRAKLRLLSGKVITEQDEADIHNGAKAILGQEIETEVKTEDVPIDIVFPHVVYEDPRLQAEVVKILVELRLMSRYTAMRKFDLEPSEEEARISDEKSLDAERSDNELADLEKSLMGKTGEEPEE